MLVYAQYALLSGVYAIASLSLPVLPEQRNSLLKDTSSELEGEMSCVERHPTDPSKQFNICSSEPLQKNKLTRSSSKKDISKERSGKVVNSIDGRLSGLKKDDQSISSKKLSSYRNYKAQDHLGDYQKGKVKVINLTLSGDFVSILSQEKESSREDKRLLIDQSIVVSPGRPMPARLSRDKQAARENEILLGAQSSETYPVNGDHKNKVTKVNSSIRFTSSLGKINDSILQDDFLRIRKSKLAEHPNELKSKQVNNISMASNYISTLGKLKEISILIRRTVSSSIGIETDKRGVITYPLESKRTKLNAESFLDELALLRSEAELLSGRMSRINEATRISSLRKIGNKYFAKREELNKAQDRSKQSSYTQQ